MKKLILFLSILISVSFFTSCKETSEEIEEIEGIVEIEETSETHIEITEVIAVTEDLLKYYDVKFVYTDLDGNEHTMYFDKNTKWTKTPSESSLQINSKLGLDFLYSEFKMSSDKYESCDVSTEMTFIPKFTDADFGNKDFYGEFKLEDRNYKVGAYCIEKGKHTTFHKKTTNSSSESHIETQQSNGGGYGHVGKEAVANNFLAFDEIIKFKDLTFKNRITMINEDWKGAYVGGEGYFIQE